jgi:UDP-N-acetyl-D-mannosaminuronate dehydrogenase
LLVWVSLTSRIQQLGDSSPLEIDIVEPNISALPESLAKYPHFRLVDCETALATADIVVMLVAHNEFKSLNLRMLEGKTVLDVINLLGMQRLPEPARRSEHSSRPVPELVV